VDIAVSLLLLDPIFPNFVVEAVYPSPLNSSFFVPYHEMSWTSTEFDNLHAQINHVRWAGQVQNLTIFMLR